MSIIKIPPQDLIIASTGLNDIPKPFERDIFLFHTYIAGSTHIENISELVEKLEENEIFNFYREPNNEFDPRAIIIKNKNKEKLGYVPEIDNIVFSRLMDAGKLLFGKLNNVEKKGKWFKINIDIFLKD